MKVRILLLLALSFVLTACDKVNGEEIVAQPVNNMKAVQQLQIETVILAEPESHPAAAAELQNASMNLIRGSDDSYILVKIAMAEAEEEDVEGKALIILVVLNRVSDDSFPDSVSEVIFQAGQFSPVGNGRYDRVEPNDECWEALDMVMDGWDESEGALYFESKSESTWHQQNLIYLFKHGKHYFYTDKEGE